MMNRDALMAQLTQLLSANPQALTQVMNSLQNNANMFGASSSMFGQGSMGGMGGQPDSLADRSMGGAPGSLPSQANVMAQNNAFGMNPNAGGMGVGPQAPALPAQANPMAGANVMRGRQ